MRTTTTTTVVVVVVPMMRQSQGADNPPPRRLPASHPESDEAALSSRTNEIEAHWLRCQLLRSQS
jgi:hypothetical protein